jgi:hypothetical protein
MGRPSEEESNGAQEDRAAELHRMIDATAEEIDRLEAMIDDWFYELVSIRGFRTACIDCGIDAWHFEENGRTVHEDFYVHDKLWWTTMPHDGIICIGCFETRAERRLTPTDFKRAGAPSLFGTPPSQRFIDRAGGTREA